MMAVWKDFMPNHYDSCRDSKPQVPAKKAEPNVTWLPGPPTRWVDLSTFFELKQLAEAKESDQSNCWVLHTSDNGPHIHRVPAAQARANVTQILENLPQGYHCVVLHAPDPVVQDLILLRVLLDPSGGYCGASGPKPAWMDGCPRIIWSCSPNLAGFRHNIKTVLRSYALKFGPHDNCDTILEWEAPKDREVKDFESIQFGVYNERWISHHLEWIVKQDLDTRYLVCVLEQCDRTKGIQLLIAQLDDAPGCPQSTGWPSWFKGFRKNRP